MEVLIADDDADIRFLMRTILEQEGHTVREAATGPETLQLVLSSPPDVLILDGILPRMDGVIVLQYLRANEVTRELPVLFISALDDPGFRNRMRQLKVKAMLSKPLDPDELPGLVESAVRPQTSSSSP